MRLIKRMFGVGVLLLGMCAQSHGAEIPIKDNLNLNIGGRFQTMGELEQLTYDQIRDQERVYLFNVEDRLFANGNYKGTKFYFETAMGGEALSTSNNQINLLEFYAEVPVTDWFSAAVGQFKVPVNLESANYEGNLLFSEKSPLMQLFFNTGYDTGIAFQAKGFNLDAILGTISGAPDLPQRYLPEFFNMPPMIIARVGYTDGIADDPFHQKQSGFEKVDKVQFAVHVGGLYINDSNAGHSTDVSLQNGYFSAASANSYYGNALLTSTWNPFLGKTAKNFGPVNAQYWQGFYDIQFRAPFAGTTFTLQAEGHAARFTASDFAPIVINGKTLSSGSLDISGGEVQASLGDNPWEIAVRLAGVSPDPGFAYNYTGTKYTAITGSEPIYELTAPSVTLHVNEHTKIVGETMFMINTPVVASNDGAMVINEMPTQVTNATAASPIIRGFVPVGRMMFQFMF